MEHFPHMMHARAGMTNYKVQVVTSDQKGAGSDSNIFLTIVGKKGDTGARETSAAQSAVAHEARFPPHPSLIVSKTAPAFCIHFQ